MRELRNVLERAAILCDGGPIDVSHLRLQSGAKALRNDTTDLSALERTTIAKVLQDCRGNKTKAARRLGCRARRSTSGFASTDSSKPSARNCEAVPCAEEDDVMRRSNRMKEIMRDVHDRIDAELHTVGLQRFGAAIAHRMELIEVLAARFNNDSRTIRRICLEVLDRIATVDPELQSQPGCGQQA